MIQIGHMNPYEAIPYLVKQNIDITAEYLKFIEDDTRKLVIESDDKNYFKNELFWKQRYQYAEILLDPPFGLIHINCVDGQKNLFSLTEAITTLTGL